MRRIQHKRGGRLLQTLDLYALLLHGDTSNDSRLEHGDVVLVPPAGPQVAISGEVRRPAIYELGAKRTVDEAFTLSGGLQATADRRRVQVERIDPAGARRLITVDVAAGGASALSLVDGDVLRVPAVLPEVQGAILIEGHVARSGSFEWVDGLRITTLLPDAAALLPRADLQYVLVRREQGNDRRTEVISVDLAAAQSAPGSASDLVLQPGDRVTVFELGVARSAAIDAILRELDLQSSSDQPFAGVRVSGNVRAPGTYPLEAGMRISRLVRAGGGLNPSAYGTTAELARYAVGADGERQTALFEVDLAAALRGDPLADLELRPYDVLTVKETPAWEDRVEIEIAGEVRFPGRYPVRRGETLAAVLERAGGLTGLAFPDGSVFTRRFLVDREARQLEVLRTRLESDIAALAVQRANEPGGKADEAFGIGQSLLAQLKSTVPTGRLVIDLSSVIANPGDLRFDIELRDGDRLVVPPRSQEVTVLGEVQYSTSHRYDPSLGRDAYIGLSGGVTARADTGRIYVVRANGAVVTGRGAGRRIEPGDSIVVPLATDRLPRLAQWSSITQIIFNLAVAVAAVNSF
jgi:protein involved in polysaccharide export with SLBB domain